MNEKEIENLINEQILCRIAFKGTKFPYIAPFQYVKMGSTLYFHFTDYGKKMRLLNKDTRVCVEIEKYLPDLSEYNFVSMQGKLSIVSDPDERARALKTLSEMGEKKLSNNFLPAHGLKTEEGWSSLQSERDLVVVKLEKVNKIIGLKSP
jgi:nitroimidazol reductase NimA-like FMN-containing flavoprotein (pyridoxamine 5'-phosphate oxidase superfamily)